jgi:Spy/CpxP family protein refolding chaperone
MGGHGRGVHERRGSCVEWALKQLDLTDQQRDALTGVMNANQEATRNRMKDMIKARQALRDAVRGDTYDEQAIRRAANEVGQIETDMALARAQMRQQLRKILTPEQFGELEGMRKAMRMHKRHGMRGGRHGFGASGPGGPRGVGGHGMGPGPDGAPPRP